MSLILLLLIYLNEKYSQLNQFKNPFPNLALLDSGAENPTLLLDLSQATKQFLIKLSPKIIRSIPKSPLD